MDLYKEILVYALAKEPLTITFPTMDINASEIVERECYKALKRIKEILGDGALDDAECFEKIEEIVCVFERMGSSGDGRHDFG